MFAWNASSRLQWYFVNRKKKLKSCNLSSIKGTNEIKLSGRPLWAVTYAHDMMVIGGAYSYLIGLKSVFVQT